MKTQQAAAVGDFITGECDELQGELPCWLCDDKGCKVDWCSGIIEVQDRAPVVKVPVLSNAMVLHLTNASNTLPPCISMPLQSADNTNMQHIAALCSYGRASRQGERRNHGVSEIWWNAT